MLDRRRVAVGVAGIVFLFAMLVSANPAWADSVPASLPAFSIQTSAPPVTFASYNFTYIAEAGVPVTAWTVTGSHVSLSYAPGSQQVLVRGTIPVGTEAISLEAQATGYSPAFQNWTIHSYNYTFISSLPAINVADGEFYNYTPHANEAGTWSFSGAPYFTLESTATGNLTGTVTPGSYLNRLTLNTTRNGNFTQVWITTDTAALSPNATFGCYIGHHYVTATMSVQTVADGCGNAGLYVGQNVILQPQYLNQTSSYNLGYSALNGYSAYVPALPPATQSKYSGLIGWFYGQPSTGIATPLNGEIPFSLTIPSSGFINYTFVPGLAPIPVPPTPPAPVPTPTLTSVQITFFTLLVIGIIVAVVGIALLLAARAYRVQGSILVAFGLVIAVSSFLV